MRRPQLAIQPDTADAVKGGYELYRQRDFSGGENRLIIPEFVQPNQLITAQNCELTPEGIIQTRLGKTPLNATLGEGPILSLFEYAKEDGTVYLVAQYGTNLYAAEYDGGATIDFGTEVKDDLVEDIPLNGQVWKDVLILANGTQTFAFDGSACTDLPVSFALFSIYAERLWYAEGSLVKFSDLATYTSYDPLNVVKVRDADGDVITGIIPQPGGLIITKNNSVWPLYGTNLDNLRLGPTPIDDNVGCIAGRTLLNSGAFLSDNGLYTFSLSEVKPVFDTHRSVIQSLTQAQKAASFGISHAEERRAFINLGDGTTLAIIEQLNPQSGNPYYGAFSWTGLNAACFAINHAAGYDGKLLIGDADNGIVYKLDNETDDNGTGIETVIRTAYNDQGKINEKTWRMYSPEMELINSGVYSYEFSYDVDYEHLTGLETVSNDSSEGSLVWDNANWGQANWGFTRLKIADNHFINVRGNRVSFGVKTLNRIKFLGYIAKFREEGYR